MNRITKTGLALLVAALCGPQNIIYGQLAGEGVSFPGADPRITDPGSPESWSSEWRLDVGSRALTPEQARAFAREVSDAAFDVYVSPRLLCQAFMRQDPELLADVALQITEGERVLLRSRRGISAEQAFELAVAVAIERNAKETLARLSRAAASIGNDQLVARIAAAEKLAAATRSGQEFLIPIDEISPEQYRQLHDGLQSLRFAKLCGDARAIDEIGKSFEGMPPCCEPHLKKLLEDARSVAAGGATIDPQLSQFFAKLAALSRDTEHAEPPPKTEDVPSDESVEVSGTD